MIYSSYNRCLSFKVRFHSLHSFKPTFFNLPRRVIGLIPAFALALSLLAAAWLTFGSYAASASSTASRKQRGEHRTGQPAARFSFTALPGVCPASFTVNDLGDSPDAAPGDELCRDAGSRCTLRAAIEEVNALPACATFVINFSVTRTINLTGEMPDLDHPNLTIQGPGANQLIVRRNTAGITASSISRTTFRIRGFPA